MNKLVLGTRSSPLAMAQTLLVKAALEKAHTGLSVYVEKFVTTGDRRMDVRLSTGQGADGNKLEKGLFTRELEHALLEGRIDAAVHSLKDLPGELPSGLEVGAIPGRAAWSDVLITKQGKGLDDVSSGSLIATSSERRRRQLLERRPDLRVTEIRGNVGTRLRKLVEDSTLTCLLLARAGLERLGGEISGNKLLLDGAEFTMEDTGFWMLPAAGQGAIAVEIRSEDSINKQIIKVINDDASSLSVNAERFLLRLLGGGCHTPVGVRAEVLEGVLRLSAAVYPGEEMVARRAFAEGDLQDPEGLARRVFNQLGEYHA